MKVTTELFLSTATWLTGMSANDLADLCAVHLSYIAMNPDYRNHDLDLLAPAIFAAKGKPANIPRPASFIRIGTTGQWLDHSEA